MTSSTLTYGKYLDGNRWKNLVLPLEMVTQPCAIMAKRGWGKTFAAKKLLECMLKAGAQVIVFDPVGNWSGIRTSADGKSAGFPIPIFGGDQADLPIGKDSADTLARLLVEDQLSAVIDVSLMRKAERIAFMTKFVESFYELKKRNRTPVHVFVEEAQLFAPQRAQANVARLLGAMEDMCRLGRNFGIGFTLISQRPQSVNKEVLNQAEILIVGATSGTQERKAIEDWIRYQGMPQGLVDQLAELPSGAEAEGFLWSPSWLKRFDRIRVGSLSTFDSSATPTIGETSHKAATLADVDVESLRAAFETEIAKADGEDPRKLRRRIGELEATLRSSRQAGAELVAKIEELENTEPKEWRCLREDWHDFNETIETALNKLLKSGTSEPVPQTSLRLVQPTSVEKLVAPAVEVEHPSSRLRVDLPRSLLNAADNGKKLGRAPLKVGEAIAQCGGSGQGRRVAILSGYSFNSSTFRNALTDLRTAGFMVGSKAGALELTSSGDGFFHETPPMPSGTQLQVHWLGKLKKAPRALFQACLEAYPEALDDRAVQVAGYSPESSTVRNACTNLRTLELASGPKFHLVAAEELFE